MIRIGFDEVADLSRFTGGDALLRALEAVYPNKSAPKPWPGGSKLGFAGNVRGRYRVDEPAVW